MPNVVTNNENLVEIVVAVVVENLVEIVLEMWEPPYWYKYWSNVYFQINSSPLQLQLGVRAGLYYQKIHFYWVLKARLLKRIGK